MSFSMLFGARLLAAYISALYWMILMKMKNTKFPGLKNEWLLEQFEHGYQGMAHVLCNCGGVVVKTQKL